MKRSLGVLCAVLAFAVTWNWPSDVSACGGFFCNNFEPMVQRGERIAFAVEGTTVTAHIQILYSGPADKFSWLLPLPEVPEFAIGTERLFDALHANTDPRFKLTWTTSEDCPISGANEFCDGGEAFGGMDGTDSTDSVDGADPNVNVLKQGDVGPFEYVVLQSDSTSDLMTWLSDNGYDQPDEAEELIAHYVNLEMKFVALKLQPNKDVGDLQPIVLTFDSPDLACVPIRLTQIAASPDMPVFTWVLGKARAIPMNYFHVLLNANSYDWLNCSNDFQEGAVYGGSDDCQEQYIKLVTDAVNSANGHGFVTEYAGSSDVMLGSIMQPGQFDSLITLKKANDPVDFLYDVFELLSDAGGSTFNEVIKTYFPCEDSLEFFDFEDCVADLSATETWKHDPVSCVDELTDRIVVPLENAQALFSKFSYLTRLYSTISPDEMNKDPLFSFNPDLPDVSNIHTSTAQIVCKEGSQTEAIGATITFPDGQSTFVPGTKFDCGGFEANGGLDGGDAAGGIQILEESGEAKLVDKDKVNEEEAKLDLKVPSLDAATKAQNTTALAKGYTGLWATTQVAGADETPQTTSTGTQTTGTGVGTNGGTTSKTPASSGSSGSSGCSHSPGSSSGIPVALVLLLMTVWGLRRLGTVTE